MRALITGAGGFVGAHLAARLVTDGWEVAGTIRPQGSLARLRSLGMDGSVQLVEVDLTDARQTSAAVVANHADVVFLLSAARAAATTAERAATTAVNATSALWVVDALGDRTRAVVRLGSSTEYGQMHGPMDEAAPLAPRGFFGATKAAGSLLVTAAAARRGLRSAVLRAFQVYGPLDHPSRLVPTALRAARESIPLALTEPGLGRDWVYVDDVVECCVRAGLADHLPPGQVLNVGTGRQATNEEVVAETERASGRSIQIAAGAHPRRDWDTTSWLCDPSRARDLLGWEAKVDLSSGLKRCWEAEWH